MAGALKELQKAVAKQEKHLQEQQWEKYHTLIDIAIGVLKHENVLLYGGAAINSLMPRKYKFYARDELMDIDVYCLNAPALFEKITRIYKQKGYPLVNIYDAMNPGTYKIQVEGVNILDVHHVSRSYFKYLTNGSLMGDLGIRCTSVKYLRTTFYKQLSEPLTAHRWMKVFERLLLFNKVYPLKADTCTVSLKKPDVPPAFAEASKKLYAYIKTTPYVILAADVYLLEGSGKHPDTENYLYPMSIIAEGDMELVIDRFISQFPEINLRPLCAIYKDTADGDISVCTLAFGKRPFLNIYFIENKCLSYVDYRGARLASLATTINYYSYMQFIQYRDNHSDEATNVECVLNLLFALHIKSMKSKTQKHRALFKQFITDCYGTETGLITRKKVRLMEKLKDKYGENYLNQMKPVVLK